jgi:hypothetical protein
MERLNPFSRSSNADIVTAAAEACFQVANVLKGKIGHVTGDTIDMGGRSGTESGMDSAQRTPAGNNVTDNAKRRVAVAIRTIGNDNNLIELGDKDGGKVSR